MDLGWHNGHAWSFRCAFPMLLAMPPIWRNTDEDLCMVRAPGTRDPNKIHDGAILWQVVGGINSGGGWHFKPITRFR